MTSSIEKLVASLDNAAHQIKELRDDLGRDLVTKTDLRATEARLAILIRNSGTRPARVRFDWTVGPVTKKTSISP